MSYDLMVFHPAAAPGGREAFLQWYEEETQWTEDHDYLDPVVTTPALRAWFLEMIKTFPAMNGPYAQPHDFDEDLDSHVASYCIGRHCIYVGFSWSVTEEAWRATRALAIKHGVGFFDVSANPATSEIRFPYPK